MCLSLQSGPGNLPLVCKHAQLVTADIAREKTEGWLLGPLPPNLPACSLIPTPHQPGKWRLIIDLSFPCGLSINDAISPEVAQMHMHPC